MWMNVTSHQFAAEDHWQTTAVTWDLTTCLVVTGDPPPVSNVSKFTWNKNTKASTQSLILIVRNVQLTKQSGKFVDRLPKKTRDKLIHTATISPSRAGGGKLHVRCQAHQPNWNCKRRKTCSGASYIILNYILITFWCGHYWLIGKS